MSAKHLLANLFLFISAAAAARSFSSVAGANHFLSAATAAAISLFFCFSVPQTVYVGTKIERE
jgi:hypothetical protein